MKLLVLGSALIVLGMGMVCSQAQAANHRHMRQLEQCHLTQLDEANGVTCDMKHHKPLSPMERAKAWDDAHAKEKAVNDYLYKNGKPVACSDIPADAPNWEKKHCID